MIDDELDRLQRIHAIGVAAELNHAVAHRSEIDHARHTGKVLQQHARGRKRNLFLQLSPGLPARQHVDVVGVHEPIVFVTKQSLEKDLE